MNGPTNTTTTNTLQREGEMVNFSRSTAWGSNSQFVNAKELPKGEKYQQILLIN